MRRAVLSAGLLVLLLPGSAPASPDPGIPDANLRASVVAFVPETAGITAPVLDLSGAVQPLEEEKRNGTSTVIRISSDVLFDFDKATLTSQAVAHLTSLAGRLRGGKVQVVGFTDNLGGGAYNLKLSKQRAASVRAALERLGITGVTARGLGEAHPVAPNSIGKKDNPAGRAQNRRVELTFRQA